MEIFKVSTLEETQGRATKEKHDGATATDMEKDGLFLKNIHGVPEKVSNGSVERPKTNTSYKTKALIYFTFFAFFCLKKSITIDCQEMEYAINWLPGSRHPHQACCFDISNWRSGVARATYAQFVIIKIIPHCKVYLAGSPLLLFLYLNI